MTFDYPASGALVDLLKEEYYIRTKTDEFVLKAVEKGEQFNKYTAVLNVEELEGTAFPYGFESDEQTIKACLSVTGKGCRIADRGRGESGCSGQESGISSEQSRTGSKGV